MKNILELKDLNSHITFSICSLVTNMNEHKEMVESFEKAGFSNDVCEFIYIDNSKENIYDGYDGLNQFLNIAKGKYIILCHQDILLNFDNVDTLKTRIQELDAIDPNWAILANAGFGDFNTKAMRLTDPWFDNFNTNNLPAQVKSVDENFILVKNDANLSLSRDIGGFHLYGTDLCAIADILGYTSYVVDFHLYHKSGGNCNESFFDSKNRFIKKYSNILNSKHIRTTCTMLSITNSSFLNKLLNRKYMYSARKRWDYIVAKFR